MGKIRLTATCLLAAPCLILQAWQANTSSAALEAARNQPGEVIHATAPSLMPGASHTMPEMQRALQTSDAVFAAYSHIPLLNPPRGFAVVHNTTGDARQTPKGLPIPIGSGLILLPYDPARREPNGRFAREEEGPVLGSISINQIDCTNRDSVREWGDDAFYYAAPQTTTVHGWPEFNGEVWLTRRTQPQWIPVSAEKVLNAQLAVARKNAQSANGEDTARPQNTYDEWLKGRDKRLADYQKTHDELVKTNKQMADQMLATLLATEETTGKMFADMAAKQGASMNKSIDDAQSGATKMIRDLEAQLNSLSPQQRAAPGYVYEQPDSKFRVGQLVPPGTPGAIAIVSPNPDFYDRTLPPWEAQSICIAVTTGPNSKGHYLYPTIVKIWESLDWDSIAKLLK